MDSKSNSTEHIIISIHYHKTGSELSQNLFNLFKKYINDLTYERKYDNKRLFKWNTNSSLEINKIKLIKRNIKYIVNLHQIFLWIYSLLCLKLIR